MRNSAGYGTTNVRDLLLFYGLFVTGKANRSTAIVKNGNLYIDGGLEIFARNTSTTGHNQTGSTSYNTALLQIDLTNSWDWKKNLTVNKLEKGQNPDTDRDAPLFVRGGSLQRPLYGGTVSYSNTSFPGWHQPIGPQYALFSYSVTDETWSQYDVLLDVPTGPIRGAMLKSPVWD